MQRMTWVNGAQKRIKLKSDKKKSSTGDAQRQFFSSERHARLVQAAPAPTAGMPRKSLDVQSLSTPPLAGGLESVVPFFAAPVANGEAAKRIADATFDKPAQPARPPAVFPSTPAAPLASAPAESDNEPALLGEKIRFFDQGKEVTETVYKSFKPAQPIEH